ncbi:PLD nuclease N-terminal domain-containing protein [Yoonia sp. 2307UL14-13]|uniref:PLD nuclease N-terminal domain-containing protein n=1 Tax=Yoonia sp. 2307UL14-13 TaxID=3126506 RepID=UPI0030B5ACA7
MPMFVFFLITLPCALYAILQVITSEETRANKVVWTLLIALAPLVGFIIWFIGGPRTAKTKKTAD